MASRLGVLLGVTFVVVAIGGDVARRSEGDPAGLPGGSSTAEHEHATHASPVKASDEMNAFAKSIRHFSAITGYTRAHHRLDRQERCSGSREGHR